MKVRLIYSNLLETCLAPRNYSTYMLLLLSFSKPKCLNNYKMATLKDILLWWLGLIVSMTRSAIKSKKQASVHALEGLCSTDTLRWQNSLRSGSRLHKKVEDCWLGIGCHPLLSVSLPWTGGNWLSQSLATLVAPPQWAITDPFQLKLPLLACFVPEKGK